MRTTLLALLLVTSACKSDEVPKVAASTTSAVAGTVVDVKGSVTLAGKPLAKGDTVTADALIDTGADSSATILLAHNGVKLELGANKHVRVNESIAWKAPKRVESGAGPDDATESAGRPAERSAAETAITAVAPQAGAGPGAPPTEASKNAATKVERDDATADRKEDDGAAAAPSNGATPKSTESARKSGDLPEGGIGITGTGVGGGASGGIGLGGIGTIGHGGGTGQGTGYGGGGSLGGKKNAKTPAVTQGKAEVSGALPADVIRRIVLRNMSRIKYCYERGLTKDPALAGKLSVKFTIGKDGKVVQAANAESTLGDAEVIACAVKVFMQMSFPAPEGGGIVTVTYPVVFAPPK